MSIWQSVIAVAGTLVAALGGTLLGNRLKSKADVIGRVHDWQVSVVGIYGDLAAALEAHYVAMWDLEAARIRGDESEVDTTLAASLVTRAAVTRPRAQLVILAPRLRGEIDRAVRTVYAMDTALDEPARTEDQLTARRLAARGAMVDLETAMTEVMGDLGAGLPGAPASAHTIRI